MRKFNINVNGKAYVVEAEEIVDGAVATAPVAVAPVAPVAKKSAPVAAAKPAPAPVAKSTAPANGMAITSKMPGLVKKLTYTDGTVVKKNEVIMILEAMKMDTPISAECDGVITYSVQPGTNVDSGAVLCTIA